MAYTGRRRGVAVEVFVPENVNPVKLARMRSFGARVTAVGADSAASEAAARERVATTKGCVYVEDGKEPTIAEGAGTIGIAEGIEVRVPVPESVVRLVALVDDMVLVDDRDLLQAMQLSAQALGLLLEPSGAAGLAAIRVHDLPGDRLATVLTGSNVRPEHLRGLAP